MGNTKDKVESAKDLATSFLEFQLAALRAPEKALSKTMEASLATLQAMTGRSDIEPDRGDKRFRDPIWQSNGYYKALMQSYLAWSRNINDWVQELEIPDRDKLRAQLVINLVGDAISPSNTVLGNPTAVQKTLESGGGNLVKGAQKLLEDAVNNGGLPTMVDKSKFKVGENLGLSEGAVIYREDHLELIQYKPTTDQVYETPIFIVPPQINKYYVWDLAPDRSIVEYFVGQGHQVFIVSWCNPSSDHADWTLENYVEALDRATDVACNVSKSAQLNMVGACSGGITAALLLAYWAAAGTEKANSMSLLVAILDTQGASDTSMGLFANLETLELARLFSRSKGVLEGRDLERAFAWLRPNDLIWAYWINNYLLGNEPPAFDILFWNADTTNLPAGLHSDMIDLLEAGGLSDGKGPTLLGHDLDTKKVTCDMFIVGGETDHITPWDGCYLSTGLFGGKSEFVLSQSGHIQSLINPPGNPKARFILNDGKHKTAEEFRETGAVHNGSWWPHWNTWLTARAGKKVKARKTLGNAKYKPLTPAPGTYIHGHA